MIEDKTSEPNNDPSELCEVLEEIRDELIKSNKKAAPKIEVNVPKVEASKLELTLPERPKRRYEFTITKHDSNRTTIIATEL